jgi:hypothetical protein
MKLKYISWKPRMLGLWIKRINISEIMLRTLMALLGLNDGEMSLPTWQVSKNKDSMKTREVVVRRMISGLGKAILLQGYCNDFKAK